jgi:hypothetical protein
MHHLLAVLAGALAAAMSATAPIYTTGTDPPEDALDPVESVDDPWRPRWSPRAHDRRPAV